MDGVGYSLEQACFLSKPALEERYRYYEPELDVVCGLREWEGRYQTGKSGLAAHGEAVGRTSLLEEPCTFHRIHRSNRKAPVVAGNG